MESPNPQLTKRIKMPVIRFFLLYKADPAIQVLSPVKYVVQSAQLCTRKGFRAVEVTKSKGRNSSCKTKSLEVEELLPEVFLAGAGGRGAVPGLGTQLSSGCETLI